MLQFFLLRILSRKQNKTNKKPTGNSGGGDQNSAGVKRIVLSLEMSMKVSQRTADKLDMVPHACNSST